jgi:hypothetical protein
MQEPRQTCDIPFEPDDEDDRGSKIGVFVCLTILAVIIVLDTILLVHCIWKWYEKRNQRPQPVENQQDE